LNRHVFGGQVIIPHLTCLSAAFKFVKLGLTSREVYGNGPGRGMPVIPGAKDMATKQKPTKEPVMKGKLFVWALFLAGLFGIFMWGVPTYRVWSAEMHGRAQKAEAEYSRDTIKIEAAARAEAEVTRAKGVAQANRIIADSLKGNQDYLHYLWIQTLSEDNKTIVYIPTEANIPIMEATRAVTPDRVE